MKIVIDKNIPHIQGVLEGVAEVSYLHYSDINSESVRDADALIVRTRTKCNRELLEASQVKFIATATIGYDHIDTEYCDEKGIKWSNAPGCNALSVTQYIASVLCYLSRENRFDLSDKTIGIVGVGEVGSRVARLAEAMGMQVLLNDPPRALLGEENQFVSLDFIAENADIISFHPFLHLTGKYKSHHLADSSFFHSLKKKPIIINSSRGEVIDSEALKEAIDKNLVSDVVLDCWENEPDIDRVLLEACTLATPHIAGYSADGKRNATEQSVQALSRFFGLELDDWQAAELAPGLERNFKKYDFCGFLTETYNVEEESMRLKASPETFEEQRANYPFRREPKAYKGNSPQGFEEQFKLFFLNKLN